MTTHAQRATNENDCRIRVLVQFSSRQHLCAQKSLCTTALRIVPSAAFGTVSKRRMNLNSQHDISSCCSRLLTDSAKCNLQLLQPNLMDSAKCNLQLLQLNLTDSASGNLQLLQPNLTDSAKCNLQLLQPTLTLTDGLCQVQLAAVAANFDFDTLYQVQLAAVATDFDFDGLCFDTDSARCTEFAAVAANFD